MALLGRLFGRTETRDAGSGIGFDLGWWGGSPGIDRRPNALLAENLSAVQGCINIISATIASLPATIYRRQGDARFEQPAHPISDLIAQGPNDRQTWPEWLEMAVSELLRYGNALSVVGTDARGTVTSLVPIPWPCIRPVLLDTNRDAPRLAFDVIASWGWFVTTPGIMRRYLDTEVLFIKDRTDDGFIGRSRISRSSEVIHNGLGLQQHVLRTWENGTSPSGILTHPKSLSHPARTRLKADFEDRHKGVRNAQRTLLLEEGLEWKPISVSPVDAEVLASRKFQTEEIARIFGVPVVLLQDYENARLSNISVANTLFGQYCILPIIRKLEAAFARSIFTDPALQLDIDMSGLMRGDYSARWAANVSAVNSGILSANEVRISEGFAPVAGGELLRLVPGAKQVPDDTAGAADPAGADVTGPAP